MTTKKVWAIVGYQVGQPRGHSYIVSSIGKGYADLKAIVKSMNSNGEGQRYTVVEYLGMPPGAAPSRSKK